LNFLSFILENAYPIEGPTLLIAATIGEIIMIILISKNRLMRFFNTRVLAVLVVLTTLVLPVTATATPILTVPLGLNPGDQYRIAFVTSVTRDATSSNIVDYNDFVNAVANSLGSLLQPLAATWSAIASTSTVSAATNIGGVSSIPIYILDGSLVATGTADLFDGTLTSAINLSDDGVYGRRNVWTGTQSDGTAYGAIYFLGMDVPGYGLSDFTDGQWIGYSRAAFTSEFYMYGISDALTVCWRRPRTEPRIAVCRF